MNWTIKLIYGVFLTSFTGSVLYIAWRIVGRILERAGLSRIRFHLLKILVLGFLMPVVYFILKDKGERREIGKGYLFAETYDLLLAGKILTAVWIAGVLFLTVLLVWNGWRLCQKTKDLFCCDAAVCTRFEEIYRSLGGKGNRLQIYQSYRFVSPCMCGVFHPKVILPVQKYGEKELDVILVHEITHYLQGDAVLKWSALLLRTLHFFNPAAWSLCREIQEWSEYSCDLKACNALGGSAKQYFQVITGIAISPSREILAVLP